MKSDNNIAWVHSCLKSDAATRQIELNRFSKRIKAFLKDPVWRFIILLRYYEYFRNKNKNYFELFVYSLIRYWFRRLSIRLGYSIPPNTCGPGLYLPHYGNIVINGAAKIGKNCILHTDIVIGANGGSSKAPLIGKNVFIGPGVKIFGEIKIADNVYIGSNAVVNKSITKKGAVIVGVPAKQVKIDLIPWWEKNRLRLKN